MEGCLLCSQVLLEIEEETCTTHVYGQQDSAVSPALKCRSAALAAFPREEQPLEGKMHTENSPQHLWGFLQVHDKKNKSSSRPWHHHSLRKFLYLKENLLIFHANNKLSHVNTATEICCCACHQ